MTDFSVCKATGFVQPAQFIASPHYNQRPENSEIDLLVIHSISLPEGQYGTPYIEALFTNRLAEYDEPALTALKGLKVSAHCVIKRDGSLQQYVPFDLRAWHAGESSFQGRSDCNNYSIGLELEGCDAEPYETQQYETLADLTAALIKCYPGITLDRIVGHYDIAPTRKTDPGPHFDWRHYKELVT